MKKVYNKSIEYDPVKSAELLKEERVQKILSLVGSKKEVLDIGCYTGDISREIKKKNNIVYGLDCNVEALKIAEKNGIECMFANLEEAFPIVSESMDLVFAAEILEHIYNTEGFLRECYRILKSGGEILISTPNINWLSFRWQMLKGKTLPFGIESGEETEFPGHCRYYTAESLKRTLEKFGFRIKTLTSDVITNKKGLKLKWLANKWPSIGYHLIVIAEKR